MMKSGGCTNAEYTPAGELLKDRQDYRRALIERRNNTNNTERKAKLDSTIKSVEAEIKRLKEL